MLKDYIDQFFKPVKIPSAQSGNFKIEHFSISDRDARDFNVSLYLNDSSDSRSIKPGTYMKLTEKGKTWMSNTPAEINDHINFVLVASGNILITGLGLGVVAAACLRKLEVISVTVIEQQIDVINLVSNSIERVANENNKYFACICDNAYKFKPKMKYDWVWHDIWPTIDRDNRVDHIKIMDEYTPFVIKGQECWQEAQVKELDEEKNFFENIFKNPLLI